MLVSFIFCLLQRYFIFNKSKIAVIPSKFSYSKKEKPRKPLNSMKLYDQSLFSSDKDSVSTKKILKSEKLEILHLEMTQNWDVV
uniref:Uncharacterized protein n=1 Tax=Lepeophtheirus salmonis TaxID=72036 RepID=A0A0K2TLE8_LEPSM